MNAISLKLFMLSLIILFCIPHCRNAQDAGKDIRAMETIQKEERLQWYKEAKFGMFIHWGPYSHLAGEWKGRQLPVGEIAEWIMHYYKIPVSEYRKMAAGFNPVKFNAHEWVSLAKNAGMRYLVITAKHHDGFAMYHSRVSGYNIVDYTAFKRDPMKELAEECRKQGIRFCFYYSHREDWDHPDAYGNDWDYDPDEKDFEKYLREKSKPQLRELLMNYGPLGLIWFDRGIYTREQAREFVSIVRELQPQCIVNGRVGNYEQELEGDYQNMSDNGMPMGGIEEYWETPQTLNETWGYSKFDTTWKSPGEVIRRLVEIVSKGGNYLLNVGPDGEGVIPGASVHILKKVGDWVEKNAESIYGTTASPFSGIPWGRCTVKGNRLYLHVFDWPGKSGLTIEGLHNKITKACLLVEPAKYLPVVQEGKTARISLPENPPDEVNTVIAVEIEGKPLVDPPVVRQEGDGTLVLGCVEGITEGKAVKRYNRKGDFHISKWTGPEDRVSWHVHAAESGTYRVEITYAANKEWAGEKYEILTGSEHLAAEVEHTGGWYEYKTFDIGSIAVQGGPQTISIRPLSSTENYLMYFKSIRLLPR